MKKILLALVLFIGLGSIMYAAGASSPITGFSWDNVRKVIRFMTSDGQEIQVPEAPKQYVFTSGGASGNCTVSTNALLMCSSAGGFSFVRGVAVPYKTVDGAWRLRLNAAYSITSASSSTLYIAGIAYKNVSGFIQPAAVAVDATTATRSYVNTVGSNQITTDTATAATSIRLSGEFELDSKPVWAD